MSSDQEQEQETVQMPILNLIILTSILASVSKYGTTKFNSQFRTSSNRPRIQKAS
jgi:hypothetical protein